MLNYNNLRYCQNVILIKNYYIIFLLRLILFNVFILYVILQYISIIMYKNPTMIFTQNDNKLRLL